jgi:hypothetical protein
VVVGLPLDNSASIATVSPLTNVFGETVIVQVVPFFGTVQEPRFVDPFLMSSNSHVLVLEDALTFTSMLDSVPPTLSVRGVTAPAVAEWFATASSGQNWSVLVSASLVPPSNSIVPPVKPA